jgi:transposase
MTSVCHRCGFNILVTRTLCRMCHAKLKADVYAAAVKELSMPPRGQAAKWWANAPQSRDMDFSDLADCTLAYV